MFSGLFLAYFIVRMFYPDMVLSSHELLDKTMGGINTVVLLTSSYTMAMGVRAAQLGDKKAIVQQHHALTIAVRRRVHGRQVLRVHGQVLATASSPASTSTTSAASEVRGLATGTSCSASRTSSSGCTS